MAISPEVELCFVLQVSAHQTSDHNKHPKVRSSQHRKEVVKNMIPRVFGIAGK